MRPVRKVPGVGGQPTRLFRPILVGTKARHECGLADAIVSVFERGPWRCVVRGGEQTTMTIEERAVDGRGRRGEVGGGRVLG